MKSAVRKVVAFACFCVVLMFAFDVAAGLLMNRRGCHQALEIAKHDGEFVIAFAGVVAGCGLKKSLGVVQ